jgi:hypothetical protein
MTVLLIELQKREEKNDAQKFFLSRGAQLIGNVPAQIEENGA